MDKKQIKKTLNLKDRMVITGGMPNGNKPLHIGHIGAVFVWADVYARFIRQILGNENVIFISGTDGFGSSTEEKYRKLKESGEIDISLEKYIEHFHNIQKETLKKYDISLNLFSVSCLGHSFEIHKQTSHDIFNKLLAVKSLQRKATSQFYDTIVGAVLNGRQVNGKCPIEGCKSEIAYADECSLGHQYSPEELIDPVSTLSGTKPELRKVFNYYFNLEDYRNELNELVRILESKTCVRKFMLRDMKDYLSAPLSFITKQTYEDNKEILENQEYLSVRYDEKKETYIFSFASVAQRDKFCKNLNANNIRFKNNKTLAPLRISGNAKWGVPLPQSAGEDTKSLTFYVWPESLWAPISFTKVYLEQSKSNTTWQDWWKSPNCTITQFIGEDNVYFYTLAQNGLWLAIQDKKSVTPLENNLQISTVIANKHLLVGNVKASSSGSTKSPTADNLLEYYTVDQLRTHFLSQNLNTLAVNFKSKVFDPEDFEKCGDPVVAQGNILTNVFNRIIRSVFYSLQTYFDGKLPNNRPDEKFVKMANELQNNYINKMKDIKLNEIMPLLDTYFREVNLNWSEKSKIGDNSVRAQLIADTIHAIKTGVLLLHPITPKSCELVREYINADEKIYDWDNSEKTFAEIYPEVDSFKFIEPRFDFFKKHESQLK